MSMHCLKTIAARASNRVLQRVPWVFGPIALAAALLALPFAAQAAIVMGPLSSGTLQVAANDGNADAVFSGSVPFAVPSGLIGSVLVVECEVYTTNNTTDLSNSVSWDGANLTLAAQEVGTASGYPVSEILYLTNPVSGSGSLSFASTSRSLMYGAFMLSGVNTNIIPLTAGAAGGSATLTAAFTLANTASTAGSFAVVSEGNRQNNQTSSPFTLTGSGSTGSLAAGASQAFSYFDGVQYEGGGGYVSNIPAGAVTITSSSTQPDRNALVAAICAPAVPQVVWSGSNGSAWDTSTANWIGSSGTSVYANGNAVIFSDTGTNTSIAITGSGVSPFSVQFTNNTLAYSLSGGAITGTAAVLLSGTGLVTFSSSNAYSGGTTISAGTLVAGANAALGSGTVTVGGGGTLVAGANAVFGAGAVNVGVGGTLEFVTAAPSIAALGGSGSVVLGSAPSQSANLTFSGSGNHAFAGAISEAAAGLGSLTMAATNSTLTLSGTSSYSGGTTVSAGTLASASQYALGSGTISLSGGALSVTGTSTYANAVKVTAPSSLNNSGSGTVSFGNLFLSKTLSVAGSGPLNFVGNTTFSGSPAFNVASGMDLTLAGPVSDGGTAQTVTVAGAGFLTLTGAGNAFAAGSKLQVNGGNLAALQQSYSGAGPATGPLGSLAIALSNASLVLSVSSTASPTTFNLVSGNAVTLQGAADTILAGTGFAGTSAVPGGTVILAGSSAVPIPAGLNLILEASNGYTLGVNSGLVFSNSGTITAGAGNISLTGGNLGVSAGTLSAASGGTLTMTGAVGAGAYKPIAGGTVVLSGVVSGGTFVPAASGTVILSGTYSGQLANLTPSNGGALVIADNTTAGTLNIAGGAYFAASASSFGPAILQLNGGTLGATTPMTLSNALVWGPSNAIAFGGASNLALAGSLGLAASNTYVINDPLGVGTLSGTIGGLGSLTIAGSPTLSGLNSYSGTTTFNGGAGATIANNQAFGTSKLLFKNGGFQASAPLTGASAIANPWAISSGSTAYFGGTNAIQLSGSIAISGGQSIYSTVPLTVGGLISGAGSLALTGPGLVAINGSNAYTGGTVLSAGTLNFDNLTALGSSTVTFAGGTLQAGAAGTLANNMTINSGMTGTFDTQANAVTLGGNIGGAGALAKIGLGSLTLLGNNTYSGGTTISAGNLQLGNGTTNGSLSATGTVVDSAVLIFDNATAQTFAGAIGGGGALDILGLARLTLTASNSFSGQTVISTGTLQLGNGTANGSLAGNISDGNLLIFNNGAALTYGSAIGGSGALNVAGPGLLTLTASNSFSGTTTISTGTLQLGNGTANGSLAGNISDGNLLIFDNAAAQTYAGAIGGSGSTALGGASLLVLAGSNSYGGGTTLSSGTLNYGNLSALGSGTVTFAGNATLQAGAAGTLANNLTINSGATGTIDTQGNAVTLGGILGGSGSLAKIGLGSLVLTGSNTYGGGTTISVGTLNFGNLAALGSGTVTFAGNATLQAGAAGTLANNLTINSGATGSIDTQSNAVTLGGILAGSGSLAKIGSGTLTLAAVDAVGGATVGAGTLAVIGSLSSGAVTANSGGSILLSGTGAVTVQNQYVGNSTAGSFSQSGGTNTVGGVLVLGNSAGASGAYSLNGSGLVSASVLAIGQAGTGSFTQSDGTDNIGSSLVLGNSAGAVGTYALGGSGLLTAPVATVGQAGMGTFAQSGGTHNVADVLNLGYLAGSSGTYGLGGSGLLSDSSAFVGYSGAGVFAQSGGTHNVSGFLYLGYNTGGSGTYNLSGSGQLSAAGALIVGYSGSATFAQSGGNNAPNALYLGYAAGGNGTYGLAGSGLLLASLENVGVSGTGAFTQTGGTNGTNNSLALYIGGDGGSGTYNLSGSGLVSAASEAVSSGSFSQSGGSNYVSGSLLLDASAGQGASYNLSGSGQISANIEYVGEFGAGSFSHSGGTNTIGSDLYLGYLAGSSGTYTLGGGQLSAPSEYVGTSGTGVLVQTGGNNSAGSLYLGSVGGSGTYSLSGSGSLSASAAYLTGAFNQSGGTNTIANQLTLGFAGAGTYNLSGSGQLSASYEFLGGAGAGNFVQSGGANNSGNILALGFGGSGSYALSGSGLLTAGAEYVGGAQPGVFMQSGGTNAISGGLYLGNGAAGGTYNLNGGLLVISALQSSGSAAFNFSGGTLRAGSGFTTALPINLGTSGGGATFDTAGNAVVLAGSLSGAGGLTVIGSGSLSLAAINNYGGNTAIGGGTLAAGVTGALPAGSAFAVYAGALDVTAAPQSVGSLAIGSSGALNINDQNLLAVGGLASFAPNSTINIYGSIIALPQLLMTYGSNSGTLGNVNFNGAPLSSLGDSLSYTSGSLEIVGLSGAPALLVESVGSWSASGQWNSTATASAPGAIASFGGSASTPMTVTLDVPRTVGTLTLGNSAGPSTNYTLAGSELTFDNSTTASAPARVVVLGGTHTISTPVEIADGSLNVVLANSGGLNLTGNIADDNRQESLTLGGDGSGQLVLSGSNSYGGGTNVEAGTLVVSDAAALSAGSSLTVGQTEALFGGEPSASGSPIVANGAAGALPVPEPSTIALLAVGVFIVARHWRRRVS